MQLTAGRVVNRFQARRHAHAPLLRPRRRHRLSHTLWTQMIVSGTSALVGTLDELAAGSVAEAIVEKELLA